jgi:geranylgeranyl diphosphate synthase type II
LTALVNGALERCLPPKGRSPQRIHEAMRYCVLSGGKRFRPLLVLGACEAAGAQARRALPVACAVELIHAYSLVHDDLPAMDNADTRRGQPSCHRAYGEGIAILVGDALLTLAFELLSRNGVPNTLAIIRTVGQASGTTGLIGGQVLDLEIVGGAQQATTPVLTDIARRKTAALIAASVRAGALAAGAGRQRLQRLARYGRDIGLAFQLIDDVHDHEGLAQTMGRDAARAQAQRLIARGISAVAPFRARADALRDVAEWLAATA